jgi:hypothetical protein
MIFKYSLLDILPPGYTGRERVWYGLGMCPHIKLKGILFPGLKRNNIITVDLIRCMIESPPLPMRGKDYREMICFPLIPISN